MVANVCHLVQFQELKQNFKTRSNNLFTKIMFLEDELNIEFKLVFKNILLGQTHISICFHPMVQEFQIMSTTTCDIMMDD
jgi:hypothetical protein